MKVWLNLMKQHPWPLGAGIMFLLITLSPLGRLMESSMLAHVLIEIPLLVIIGLVLGLSIKKYLAKPLALFNAGGITGLLLASITILFWMIPRWLDASLVQDWVAWAKYLSLPLLCGLPLACSWQALHSIAKAVVKIEFLTMLFRLGWLYLISPDRLCNSYVLREQELLGQAFLIIGISLSLTWLIPLFFGESTIDPAKALNSTTA